MSSFLFIIINIAKNIAKGTWIYSARAHHRREKEKHLDG